MEVLGLLAIEKTAASNHIINTQLFSIQSSSLVKRTVLFSPTKRRWLRWGGPYDSWLAVDLFLINLLSNKHKRYQKSPRLEQLTYKVSNVSLISKDRNI